jgi:PAS domain S-box-containing protein
VYANLMLDINAKELLAEEALRILETVRDSFLLLDEDLQVVYANKSFYSTFSVTQEETVNKKVYEIGNGQWNIPDLRVFIEETLSKNQEFHGYKVTHTFPTIGKKVMLLNGAVVKRDHRLTILAISDITDRENAHAVLTESIKSLEKINSYMTGRELKMVELKEEIVRLNKTISDSLPKS